MNNVAPETTTGNLSELMNLGGQKEFFPSHPNLPFRPMSEIVGLPIIILDVVSFENDKGPGCAVRILADGQMCRIVTHSDAIRKVLTSEEFRVIMMQHPDGISTKIVTRHSNKTGRDYYALS